MRVFIPLGGPGTGGPGKGTWPWVQQHPETRQCLEGSDSFGLCAGSWRNKSFSPGGTLGSHSRVHYQDNAGGHLSWDPEVVGP